jgi:hypothetical protein
MIAPTPQGPWPYNVPPPDEYLEDAAQPLFLTPPPHRRHHAFTGSPYLALLIIVVLGLLIAFGGLALAGLADTPSYP